MSEAGKEKKPEMFRVPNSNEVCYMCSDYGVGPLCPVHSRAAEVRLIVAKRPEGDN